MSNLHTGEQVQDQVLYLLADVGLFAYVSFIQLQAHEQFVTLKFQGDWICPVCTLKNKPSQLNCEVCSTACPDSMQIDGNTVSDGGSKSVDAVTVHTNPMVYTHI